MARVVESFLVGNNGFVYHIQSNLTGNDMGPLLLTWFNFDPNMDK